MINTEHFPELLKRFQDLRLLVVGDLMLDHYIWGRVERISPEAPVPVVAVSRESIHLGGAANVGHNIVSLGGKVDLCGLVGDDDSGRRILQELKTRSIRSEGVRMDPDRPTTIKTRIIAHSQQVVRFDREDPRPISEKTETELIRTLRRRLPSAQAVVVSDYAKGVVTGALMSELIGLARRNRIPLLVDPKVPHIPLYKGARVVTPNQGEALRAAGLTDGSDRGVARAGKVLLERLGCQAVLITRGEHGMTLCEKNREPVHIPTMAREVYDVTGAGDTVIATMALGLAAGAKMHEAAVLANCAAGIVVGIVGTVPIQRTTLLHFLEDRIRE